MTKWISLSGRWTAKGEKREGGILGEMFNIGKKEPVSLATLINAVVVGLCEFAWSSYTYDQGEIRQGLRVSSAALARMAEYVEVKEVNKEYLVEQDAGAHPATSRE